LKVNVSVVFVDVDSELPSPLVAEELEKFFDTALELKSDVSRVMRTLDVMIRVGIAILEDASPHRSSTLREGLSGDLKKGITKSL